MAFTDIKIHKDIGLGWAARVNAQLDISGYFLFFYSLLTVFIILADEDHRQFPETGHIVGLEDLPLIRRSVSIDGKVHAPIAAIGMRQSDASAQRHLSTDDSVAAVEVLAVRMHGAPLTPGAAHFLLHEFGYNVAYRDAHYVRPAV